MLWKLLGKGRKRKFKNLLLRSFLNVLVLTLMLTNCLLLSSPVWAEDESPTEPGASDVSEPAAEDPQETPQDSGVPQDTPADPVDQDEPADPVAPQDPPADPTEPQDTPPADPTEPQDTPQEPIAETSELTLNLTLVNLDGANGREALAPITVANDITMEALLTLLFSEGMPPAEDGSVFNYWTVEGSGQIVDPAALLTSYLTAEEAEAGQASLVLLANWDKSDDTPSEGYTLILHYRDAAGEPQIFEREVASGKTPADVIVENFGDSELFRAFHSATHLYEFKYFALTENGAEPYPVEQPVAPEEGELVLYAVYDILAYRLAEVDAPFGPPVTAMDTPEALLAAGLVQNRAFRLASATRDTWEHPTEPGEVKTYKTARSLEDEGLVNTYEVTLRVEAKNIKTPTDVVLILDTSGSMATDNRLQSAKSAGQNLVNRLIPDSNSINQVGLVTFSSVVNQTVGLTNQKDQINYVITNQMYAYGGTFTQAAILKAKEILDEQGRPEA